MRQFFTRSRSHDCMMTRLCDYAVYKGPVMMIGTILFRKGARGISCIFCLSRRGRDHWA